LCIPGDRAALELDGVFRDLFYFERDTVPNLGDFTNVFGSAVAAGVVDMKPADPIEGILVAQLVVPNEGKGWSTRRCWYC
jgi:hypothetical protein